VPPATPGAGANAHLPRKRFGQHFLVDTGVIDHILRSIAPRPDDRLVEIGPGLGALTHPLLARVPFIEAVEIDRDLAAELRRAYPPERLRLHEADVLDFDFSLLPAGLRLMGNLPYNISTPLLFHLQRYADRILDCHFMLQKEVADRMAAVPGDDAYGRLSVMLQHRFDVEALFLVGPESFRPPPKVDSAVVRMTPVPEPLEVLDRALFEQVVGAGFGQRRKTMRNSLAGLADAALLERLGVDPRRRAEELSLAEFVRLSNGIAAARRPRPE
jgi:16S rRNA (adenine1518-N6/adenine1519-N6)-dimethyltransferase